MKDDTKVFLLVEYGKYKTITYAEFKNLCDLFPDYSLKKLVPFKAGLLEMSPDDYTAFYKVKRRNKYLREQDKKHGSTSLDALDAEKLSKDKVLKQRVEEEVIQSLMMEQLFRCINLLDEDEQRLFCAHYFENISEVELATMYGISQPAISKRLSKILRKLKKQIKM